MTKIPLPSEPRGLSALSLLKEILSLGAPHMAFWYNPNSLNVTAGGIYNPQILPALL
jgi:hypothetical protein